MQIHRGSNSLRALASSFVNICPHQGKNKNKKKTNMVKVSELSGKTGLWLISRGARHQKPQIKYTDSSIWETCKTSAPSFSKPLLSAFPSLKISSNQKLKQFSNLGKRKSKEKHCL